jgi:hypothetical protein
MWKNGVLSKTFPEKSGNRQIAITAKNTAMVPGSACGSEKGTGPPVPVFRASTGCNK